MVKRRIDPSKSPGRLDDIKRKPVPNADSKDRRGDKDQLWTMTMSKFQLELTLYVAHSSGLNITRRATIAFGRCDVGRGVRNERRGNMSLNFRARRKQIKMWRDNWAVILKFEILLLHVILCTHEGTVRCISANDVLLVLFLNRVRRTLPWLYSSSRTTTARPTRIAIPRPKSGLSSLLFKARQGRDCQRRGNSVMWWR